jgi:ribonucleoside-triphosphate reductase
MVKFGYIETDELGNKFYTDKGIKFSDKIFKVLNDVKDNFTDEYSFNIESIPAERAAVILCGKDSTYFGVNDFEIYSNQWIPLTAKCTINEKIRTAAILDNKCSGGAIAHINLESNFPTSDEAWYMLNYIASQGVIYFCFNTKINVCKHRHAFVGTDICPICGEPVFDTYQRVVGFLTPSMAYSIPRNKEFNAREWYDIAVLMSQASLIGD